MTAKNHHVVNNIHHKAKKKFDSKIISRDRDCNKCCKRHSNQHNVIEIHPHRNKLPNPYDLIKPCYVHLRRLNLWGHDGNKLSNCCPTLSEMNSRKESVVNKKSDKLEHDNSMTNNRNGNLYEENKDFIQKRMDLLFETLCQTFSLIKAKKSKKRKYEETKKIDCAVSFSYNAVKQRLLSDASTGLIDDISQGKNQSTKICNISYLPDFKNIEEKPAKQQNFNEDIQHSYEGNGNGIEIISCKNINNMHIRDASFNEIYSDNKNKNCKIRKIYPKNNCDVPLVNSTTKISSRFSAESTQDKIIQANVLHLPLKNNTHNVSSPKTKSNEKSEKPFGRNNKVNIEIQKKHAVQKNLKGTTKNYRADKEFNDEVCFSNLNMKNIGKADIVLVEDSDPEIEILGECTVERNSYETSKKYLDDISNLISEKNSHRSDSNKCVKDADTIETNEYNISPTIVKDVSNSCILQMEILNKQTKPCIYSADHSISFAKFDRVPKSSTISEFTVCGKHVLSKNNNEITPLIKPCYVALYKLPIDKSMEFIDPIVKNSFCHENASYSVVEDGSRRFNFEAEKYRNGNKSFCSASSDSSISSSKGDEIISIDDDNVSAINETITVDEIPNVNVPAINEAITDDEIPNVNNVSSINETMNVDEIPNIDNVSTIDEAIDEIPNADNASAIKESIKVDEIPNVDISTVNETANISYKKKHFTILPCSVFLKDIRNGICCKKCTKRRRKLLLMRQKKERKKCLLERDEYVKEWLLKIEEWVGNPELMKNMDENFCRNSKEVSVSQENLQICHTSSDILPKCPLDNFKIVNCSVLLERINLDEYLIKNKDIFSQHDLKYPSENIASGSSFNKVKEESSSSVEDISEINIKKPKEIVDNCTTENPLKNNKTLDNHSNIICHSDYKCVQCNMPISSDDELYHHLCCGKRKKGYICDFCEKIFGTIHGLQKHMNYHYKFIS